jgi:hypothetical protein
MGLKRLRDGVRERVAIDRQRAAGRDLIRIGAAHDERAKLAHLGVEQPDRVVGGVIRTKRIGADELCETGGLMGLGHPVRPHLVQHDRDARVGDLPRSLGPGKAGADNMDERGLR